MSIASVKTSTGEYPTVDTADHLHREMFENQISQIPSHLTQMYISGWGNTLTGILLSYKIVHSPIDRNDCYSGR